MRTALANSLNVPTIRLMDGLGVQRLAETADAMGLVSMPAADVARAGLAAALGGDEVTLLDLATAYHTLANQGVYVPPTPILRITDGAGQPVLLQPSPEPRQALSPETAFLVTNILSDKAARSLVFGANSRLDLSKPAAAKTGTTTNFRDNWTLGYTRYLVTGVWAGNNDGKPMRGADGITGAGPIWNKFMEAVLADPQMLQAIGAPEAGPDTAWDFTAPDDMAQIDRPCPRELRCPQGGEYFTQAVAG